MLKSVGAGGKGKDMRLVKFNCPYCFNAIEKHITLTDILVRQGAEFPITCTDCIKIFQATMNVDIITTERKIERWNKTQKTGMDGDKKG